MAFHVQWHHRIKKEKEMTNLVLYDIDETLFHTTANIKVISDKGIKYLNNMEFNNYQLESGEQYDFSEFRDSDTFYNESKPITRQIDNLNADIELGNDVYLITARANFNNKEKFLDTFRKHNIAIDSIRVERCGNINDISEVSIKKSIIIYNILKTKQYKTVKLVDDSITNLMEFMKLKQYFPNVQFETELA